ncbi:MAG: redoxin domain-containing protein [Bacteroidota bacterium]|nr:redoxin domain-containing protein [Bacteroidota bacterium]
MNILQIGDKAPGFTLFSTDKQQVSLSDYHGKKVLLIFFPFAFSGTCTKEMCLLRDGLSGYINLKVDILALSVDSPYTLAKFKEFNNLGFTFLSDFNKTVSKAYGCLKEEFSMELLGVAKRSAFVIDEESTIKYIEILENADDLPNFEAINTILLSLN